MSGEHRNGRAQLALGARLAHLLRQHVGDDGRPVLVEQAVDTRHGVQREIGRERNKLRGRNRVPGFQIGRHRLAQPLYLCRLVIGQIEHVFVDEALPRQGAAEIERIALLHCAGGFAVERLQQCKTQSGEQAFERDIADGRGLQQREQQLIAAKRRDPCRTEQFVQWQPARPGAVRALDRIADRIRLLEEQRNRRRKLVARRPRPPTARAE